MSQQSQSVRFGHRAFRAPPALAGSSVRRFWARAFAACVLALLLTLTAPLRAEPLTPLRAGALPPLQTAAPLIGVAQLDGATIALAGNGAWRLDAGASQWRALHWDAAALGAARAVVGDGAQAYVFAAGDVLARLQADATTLRARALPAAPEPLRDAVAAWSADTLYLAGLGPDGAARFYQRPLGDDDAAWTAAKRWTAPGAPRSLLFQTKSLFVALADPAGGADRLLRWTPGPAAWTDAGRVPGQVVPGAGRATGQAHLLIPVQPVAHAPARLKTYQTITGAWAELPGAQVPSDAVATAVWPDGLMWARSDGARTQFATAQIQSNKLRLHWLDWVVIVVYLAGMIGIGLYFYLREKRGNTASFFVGGRSIPFWAAGISLYAANTSSISFIAIPAKAFETNWQYMANNIIAVGGLIFVAIWVVPLLRRLDLMSVFSYLETRFHPSIRMLASALCVFVQIGSRMSVILFLPALAIATITGISVFWSVLLMGGFTIVYTAMGGMKAVIWTDFVQVIVKMGGAIFAIGFMIWGLRGGFGQFWSTAMAEGKMHTFDFSFDLTKATIWGFLFLVLFEVVLTFPKDQVLMQRTLSTSSAREAGRSIWAFAAIMIPGGIVFYTIGTAMFVYYREHPERMNPLLPIDATFPMFIAAELPVGVTGLIIAGIFAAAMATLSGIMNSVATLISVDFYEKLHKGHTPQQSVRFAELMTVVVGLIGIGAALLLSKFDIHSLFDVSIELAGLLGGGFAGAYTLGMFTRRANWQGVAIGIGASIVLTLGIWTLRAVHPYYYLAISIALCIVIGYLASLFFPAPSQSLEGLTIFRSKPSSAASERRIDQAGEETVGNENA
ncbi:sodium/solute symporter [Lysobacter sp. K5869]|uniref:sodium:solute symporter family transporter n=1 Tax=Lysobacter sp. K5869 TaxID=2820808 RepID=UPI001C05F377|nr:sodium/solute symporter [Lysobacter sp. K5869]QWP77932.1 sodium/solute symporter [Lysobacter sp. K5869]